MVSTLTGNTERQATQLVISLHGYTHTPRGTHVHAHKHKSTSRGASTVRQDAVRAV